MVDLHAVPHSGLILVACDSPTLSSYYIPEIGPAPKWAGFLDSVTEELADDPSAGPGKGAYSDFKFIDKAELETYVSLNLAEEMLMPDLASITLSVHPPSNRTCTDTSSPSNSTPPPDSSPIQHHTPTIENESSPIDLLPKRSHVFEHEKKLRKSTRRWRNVYVEQKREKRQWRSARGRRKVWRRKSEKRRRREACWRMIDLRRSLRIPTTRWIKRVESLRCSTLLRRTST